MKNVITWEDVEPAHVTARFILSAFGMSTNRVGWIVDYDNRQPVPGLDGKPVKISEFAGIIKTKDGLRLVRDSIVDLIVVADHVK